MGVDHFEALSQKARQALAEGKLEEARQLYLESLGIQPDSPDAHYGLATACFLSDDLEGAIHHFREVTKLDPLRAGAYVNLGAVYNRMEKLDEAVKALRRGIQLDNQRAEGYYNLGLVYRRMGQAEQAVQAYREATHLNPRMADAHYNLANLLMDLGRYSQAAAHYRHVLQLQPKFEKARVGLEQAEAGLQEEEQSVKPGRPAAETPAAAAQPTTGKGDLNRTVDPQADGNVLAALHEATIQSESFGRSFLKSLETEVEPAIKELSTGLLYPEKAPFELGVKIQKFEAALNALKSTQKNVQHSMKRLREVSNPLFGVKPPGPAKAAAAVSHAVVFKTGAPPSDELRYVQQVCTAVGLSLTQIEEAQLDIRYVSESELEEEHMLHVAQEAGFDLKKCKLTPFTDRDGGRGALLRVLA